MADDNDPINKLIDAKMQFRLKRINDKLAEQGRKPITLKELMMRDQFDASTPSAKKTDKKFSKTKKEVKKPSSKVISADFKPKPTSESVVPSEVTDIRQGSLQKFLDSRYGTNEGIELSKYRDKLSKLPSSDNKIKLSALFNILSDNDHVLNTNEVNFIKHVLNNLDTIDLNDPKISKFIEKTEQLITDENIRDALEAKRQETLDKSLKKLPTVENKKLNELNIENEKLLAENPELWDERVQKTESRFLQKQDPHQGIQFKESNLDFANRKYKGLIDDLRIAFNSADDDDTKKFINDTIEKLQRGTPVEKAGIDIIEEPPPVIKKDPVAAAIHSENKLSGLSSRQPQVEYADFRNALEKTMDSASKTLKLDNLKRIAMGVPTAAGKVLQYAAPPMAAYDLFWNKPRESAKEIQEKGLGQELAELGLDFAALGAPAARMAGKAALGATLDTVALPLGAYLAGKEFFPGNEYISDEEREKLAIEEEKASKMPGAKYLPIFAPEQDQPLAYDSEADKMYNYSKIKNLLKK